jgi:hypothetical protein
MSEDNGTWIRFDATERVLPRPAKSLSEFKSWFRDWKWKRAQEKSEGGSQKPKL